MSLLRFHANVYALPEGAQEGAPVVLRGVSCRPLGAPGGGPPLFLQTLPVTFDAMQQRLGDQPRCDCEPDGFFLLTGHTPDGAFWRVSGHMHEFQPDGAAEPAMHRTELSGECPPETLDALLRVMGWPGVDLAFELVAEGVTLREADFRSWAAA